MANHPSALKRARQNERQRLRNKAYRTRVRNAIKAVRGAVAAKTVDKAQEALAQAVPIIMRASTKGVLHRNHSARKIARLSKAVHALAVAS
ncbi:MAG: 30S ribosomal protein S20 [Pseudomonadota bacterium]